MIYEQLQMNGLESVESILPKLPLFPQDSRVSLTALRERVGAIVTSVTCGERLRECSEKFARVGSSVRIRPVYFQERINGISVECSMTLPRWGITRGGEYGELVTWERRTSGSGCSLWRTPTASDGEFSGRSSERLADRWENQKQKHLSEQVAHAELRGGGVLSGNLHYTYGKGRGADEPAEHGAVKPLDQERRRDKPCGTNSGSNVVSDAYGIREQQPGGEQQEGRKRACDVRQSLSNAAGDELGLFGRADETAGSARRGNDQRGGAPRHASGEWWEVEPDVGRVAHGVSARVDRLRCLGNAVVPYQAYPIFEAIAEYELTINS